MYAIAAGMRPTYKASKVAGPLPGSLGFHVGPLPVLLVVFLVVMARLRRLPAPQLSG